MADTASGARIKLVAAAIAAHEELAGPRGPTGDTGDAGPKGDKGVTGDTGPEPAPAFEGSLTTHDATSSVVVATYTPAHNTLTQVEAAFVGRQQDGSNAKARKATAS